MNFPRLIPKFLKLWHFCFLLILTGVTPVQNGYTQSLDHKTILVLGDSLSAGYGIPLQSAWVSLLSDELKSLNYQIENASISGETTDGGLRSLPQLLEQHQPSILILELGANDGLRGFPINTIKQNLSSLIEQAKAQHAKVLLLGMHIPPNYGKRYAQAFHQIYHDLSARYDTALLPFLLQDVAINEQLMQEDRLHPTSEAQPIIKKHVKAALEPLL